MAQKNFQSIPAALSEKLNKMGARHVQVVIVMEIKAAHIGDYEHFGIS